MDTIIVGVDGGGTKTKISVVDEDGTIIGSAEGSNINYNNIGVEKAYANFKQIMEQLPLDYGRISALSIGDPALDDICVNPHTESFLYKIKKNLPLSPYTKIFIKSDVYMALYGFTRGQAGVLVVSGTGSMGAAIDEQGGFYVSGGWGFPVSDTGSGYDIAVDAFRYIFNAFDKYGNHHKKPGGMLAASALEYYGVSHPRELINCFHGEHNSRAKVAEFSKIVNYCAERNCAEAVRILENAGKHLANCGCNLIGKIKYPPGRRPLVGLYGSVLINDRFVQKSFTEHILRKYPAAEIAAAEMPPEYAAAVYARNRMEQEAREEYHAVYR